MYWHAECTIGLLTAPFREGKELGKPISIPWNQRPMLGFAWTNSHTNRRISNNAAHKIAMGWACLFFHILNTFSISAFMLRLVGKPLCNTSYRISYADKTCIFGLYGSSHCNYDKQLHLQFPRAYGQPCQTHHHDIECCYFLNLEDNIFNNFLLGWWSHYLIVHVNRNKKKNVFKIIKFAEGCKSWMAVW